MRATDLTTVVGNASAVEQIRQGQKVRTDMVPRQGGLEALAREKTRGETVRESQRAEGSEVQRRDEGKGKRRDRDDEGRSAPRESILLQDEPDGAADPDPGHLIDLKA